MSKKKQPTLLSRIKDLEEWKVSYIRNVDFVFNAIDLYLRTNNPDVSEGVLKWYDDFVNSIGKDESMGSPQTDKHYRDDQQKEHESKE